MRKILIASIGLGLLFLFVILPSCAQNLQPQVDKLQKENESLR